MNKSDPKKDKLYESSLIKSIRRGLVDDSIFWATRLIFLRKEEVIWKRLLIHLSEDVGLANPTLASEIHALRMNYEFIKNSAPTSFESGQEANLPIIHAVMLMAKSKKSREVDCALVYYNTLLENDRDIPDYAIDYHSPRGKRMGRDMKHFFDEAGWIDNKHNIFPKLDLENKARSVFGLTKLKSEVN